MDAHHDNFSSAREPIITSIHDVKQYDFAKLMVREFCDNLKFRTNERGNSSASRPKTESKKFRVKKIPQDKNNGLNLTNKTPLGKLLSNDQMKILNFAKKLIEKSAKQYIRPPSSRKHFTLTTRGACENVEKCDEKECDKMREQRIPKRPATRGIETRIKKTVNPIKPTNTFLLCNYNGPLKNQSTDVQDENLSGITKAYTKHHTTTTLMSINNEEQIPIMKPVPKINDYIIGHQIGQGAYATVKLATSKATGEKFAIKIYEKCKLCLGHRKACVGREMRLLRKIAHPNIIKLHETIDTPRQLFLIMELAKGQSLLQFVRSKSEKRLDEKTAITICKQVLQGIAFCHQHNVTHRDIKMDNILVEDDLNTKIIDFGFAICSPKNQKLSVFCGTPSYMAPEIVGRKEYFGPPSDMWSIGVLYYAMLCGSFPFKGGNDFELYRNISKGLFGYPSYMAGGSRRIISRMLSVDPNKRPTAVEALNDPIFSTGYGSSLNDVIQKESTASLKNYALENMAEKCKEKRKRSVIREDSEHKNAWATLPAKVKIKS